MFVKRIRSAPLLRVAWAVSLISASSMACSSRGGGSASGSTGTSTSGGSSGGSSSSSGGSTGGLSFAPFNAGFTQTTSTPLSFGVTVSGETLAENGLPFCPISNGDPFFVDGWNLSFSNYIVVIDNVRLNANPLKDSTWQDMDGVVATKKGPFVVDVHNCKNGGFVGKDGEEPASGLFLWTQQDNGQPFDPSVRYAFSYDIVEATLPAINVNLDSSEAGLYQKMVDNHWSKMIVGQITQATNNPYADASNPSLAVDQANFAQFPTAAEFSFGWDDHTSMLNCVNADLGAEDDLANRGIQANPNGMYIAQITIHTDHVFWDKVLIEGEPLRIDPVMAFVNASLAEPDGGVLPFNTPFDLNADAFGQGIASVFDDGNSTALPDRGPYQINTCANAGSQFKTDMGNGYQVVMNVNGVPASSIKLNDYRTFMAFSAQSQAHLNAQGLCYIVGQHAADPWYQPAFSAEVP